VQLSYRLPLGTSKGSWCSPHMRDDDFEMALTIAGHYLERRGIDDPSVVRDLGDHVVRVCKKGEHRPLIIANRAALMERQLEVEEIRHMEADASSCSPHERDVACSHVTLPLAARAPVLCQQRPRCNRPRSRPPMNEIGRHLKLRTGTLSGSAMAISPLCVKPGQ
jgi:hypothetical protein